MDESAKPKTWEKFKLWATKHKKTLQIVVPIVVILLLFLFGLIQQGIVGGWLDNFNRATATLRVQDAKQQPIENAQILLGDSTANTDITGNATVTGLVAGTRQLTVRKTGFLTMTQDVVLKRGANSLGSFVLKEAPLAKVNLGLKITDYVSEASINDATVSLNDLKPILQGSSWQFNNVPVGDYKLTISKSGYNTASVDVTVDQKTTKLDEVKLVPAGVIVFESNRDKGLRGIFTASYNGTDQKNLVARTGDFEDYSPVLGPNQRKVFFTSTRDGAKNDSGEFKTFLYVVDVDGKNLTKISQTSDSYNAMWSPDGSYIGFVNYDSTNKKTRLYTYGVTNKSLNTFSGYDANSNFAFSADGSHIAFGANQDSDNTDGLFYGQSNGQGIQKIDTVNSYSLEFTATGTFRYSYYDNTQSKTRYFEYDPVANSKTEISAPQIDKVGAILSPDKKLRAYVSTRDGKANLYISDASGKNEVKLTDLNHVVSGDLLWSKDSSFIMFNLKSDAESARYLVSINGQAKAKKIVDINLTYNG